MLKIKKLKKNILIYFQVKNYLKKYLYTTIPNNF